MKARTFLFCLLLYIQHLQNTLTPGCQVLNKWMFLNDFLNLGSWHSVYASSTVAMSKQSCSSPGSILFSSFCGSQKVDGFQVHSMGLLSPAPALLGCVVHQKLMDCYLFVIIFFLICLLPFSWFHIPQVLYNFSRFLAHEYHHLLGLGSQRLSKAWNEIMLKMFQYIFTVLCKHPHNLNLEHFHHCKNKAYAVSSDLLSPHPL